MKIAFFGTPEFTVEILDTLLGSTLKPELIVTGEDVPVGRKLILTKPGPKVWAEAHGVLVVQPKKIDATFIEEMKKQSWDLFVVVAYGKILPKELIDIPTYGTINVHYSLLPKYRGATPVESALLNQDVETGVCIQHMVYELDAGDILAQVKTPITKTENHEELRTRLNDICKPLLIEVVKNIEEKIVYKVKQDSSQKTICKKIKKSDGEIKLDEDAKTLYAKFRAYYGWPGIYFFTEKKTKTIRVKITDARLENNIFVIKKVIPEGKKEISWEDFSRQ